MDVQLRRPKLLLELVEQKAIMASFRGEEIQRLGCFAKLAVKSPIDAFNLFLTRDLVKLIVEQTNVYAASNGERSFQVSEEEIFTLLGVLLLSGYRPYPSRRFYWNLADDKENYLVANAIRRTIFESILQFLHLADNSKLVPDSMFKVQPLFDSLNEFFKIMSLGKSCTVDESMIPYYGHHVVRTKKWWWPFFGWAVDVSCVQGGFYIG
ncbi:hypothetical protein J437_LFUL001851, partial [Ladona fulva]